ncbi:MAG: SDR family oxidoreductase [Patescibacteria group bacterium]|nr:SDR family oxidoreductase [Patescibacteria group bacterium]
MGEKSVILRICVTGGAGYLGSLLVPRLLEEDYEVTVLDNCMFGNDTILASCCANRNFEIYRVDCRDVDAMRPYLAKADVVIPLAALVGAPICYLNPTDADILNRISMLRMLEGLSKDQFVIFPSTESVYGKQSELCDEQTLPNPLVSYGVQKLEVERAIEARGNGVSFRMATLFGMSPRMRLDLLVNDFTWRAMKDRSLVVFEGKAMRTCLHVDDAARAFVHILQVAPPAYEVYNIGSVYVSKLGLCKTIQSRLPEFFYTEAQYHSDPDKRDYVVSDKKIRATGYEPEWTLEQGIDELLKGYRCLHNSRHSNMP